MAKVKLTHSIGAVQAILQLIERHPGLLAKLQTAADRTYVTDGLGGAIQHLQWLHANETAVRAALAALKSAQAAAPTHGAAP